MRIRSAHDRWCEVVYDEQYIVSKNLEDVYKMYFARFVSSSSQLHCINSVPRFQFSGEYVSRVVYKWLYSIDAS